MDPINSHQSAKQLPRSALASGSSPEALAEKPGGGSIPVSNSLPDIASLASHAATSESDVREQALARGKALLEDPNWLSDYNIDGLANKLLDIEDI